MVTAANPQFAAVGISRRMTTVESAGRWFVTDLNAKAGVVDLVRADGAELRAVTFLDERWRLQGERKQMPLSQLRAGAALAPRVIFHTAFCGSTLLARALDVGGRTLVLREPGVFGRLSNLKREQNPLALHPETWSRTVAGVLGLMSDAGEPRELVGVKLSNICNNMIADVLASSAAARAVLLYSDPRSFLVSVLKKGEQGRGFVRRLCLSFSLDLPQVRDVPARELLLMTDLQVAAAVWLLQMELFAQALRGAGGRVRTLNADRFLNEPKPVLAAVSAFLELGLDAATIDAVVAGPVFRRNSKAEARPYDLAQRREEERAIEAVFGPELDRVVEAVQQGWRGLKMPALPLANDLLGGA